MLIPEMLFKAQNKPALIMRSNANKYYRIKSPRSYKKTVLI